jgi:hypothetical protein
MAVSRLAKMTALGAPLCGKPSTTKVATETRVSTTTGPTKTATKRKRAEIASATTILARRRAGGISILKKQLLMQALMKKRLQNILQMTLASTTLTL